MSNTLRVLKPEPGAYIVTTESGRGAVFGDLDKTLTTLRELGIDEDSIEACLTELERNNHKVAYFGIFRKFLFTQ